MNLSVFSSSARKNIRRSVARHALSDGARGFMRVEERVYS